MANGKVPETTPELLDRIANFLGDASGQSLPDLEDEVRSLNIDPDALVERVQELVRSSLEAHRLAWKEKARREREFALRQLSASEAAPSGRDLKEKVAALLVSLSKQGSMPGVQAYWRKFEKATEHDLIVLLEDLQHLERLRNLTDGDGDGTP